MFGNIAHDHCRQDVSYLVKTLEFVIVILYTSTVLSSPPCLS